MPESYGRMGITLRAEQIQDIREIAKQKLFEAIMAKGKRPEDYDITEILPKEDMGLPNEEWAYTYTAAYDEEDFVNQTLPDDKFVVLYGYTNTNATPSTLKFTLYKGASTEEIVTVQQAYAQQEPFVFFDPIVYSEGDQMRITLYGNSASDDNPVFLGFTAVTRGTRLTKQ